MNESGIKGPVSHINSLSGFLALPFLYLQQMDSFNWGYSTTLNGNHTRKISFCMPGKIEVWGRPNLPALQLTSTWVKISHVGSDCSPTMTRPVVTLALELFGYFQSHFISLDRASFMIHTWVPRQPSICIWRGITTGQTLHWGPPCSPHPRRRWLFHQRGPPDNHCHGFGRNA